MTAKTYDYVELPPLDLAVEKSICFGYAYFPSCESKLDQESYGDQWINLQTSDLQRLSIAFTTLPDQSLQWLLEIGVTLLYQISLTPHQVVMNLYGPPSFLICPFFEIACAGEVLSQPPIYLQPPLRANTNMKYENSRWLRFAGDSNSSILYVGETHVLQKASECTWEIFASLALFGFRLALLILACLDTFKKFLVFDRPCLYQ